MSESGRVEIVMQTNHTLRLHDELCRIKMCCGQVGDQTPFRDLVSQSLKFPVGGDLGARQYLRQLQSVLDDAELERESYLEKEDLSDGKAFENLARSIRGWSIRTATAQVVNEIPDTTLAILRFSGKHLLALGRSEPLCSQSQRIELLEKLLEFESLAAETELSGSDREALRDCFSQIRLVLTAPFVFNAYQVQRELAYASVRIAYTESQVEKNEKVPETRKAAWKEKADQLKTYLLCAAFAVKIGSETMQLGTRAVRLWKEVAPLVQSVANVTVPIRDHAQQSLTTSEVTSSGERSGPS